MAAAATAVAPGWLDLRRWSGQPASVADRLSPREWLRMYRTLGIGEDASREQVMKATTRLRKKYADNEASSERVETASLWIMTKMMSKKEEALRQRQQANRLRELGDSPRRMFQKYVAGYLPPSVRQMFAAPDGKHFRTASGLLGIFALLGLCVPTQASNFVGLGAAATLGLVYQRGRPEPVKDEFGNVGAVQKLNYKEVGASLLLVALGGLLGTGASFGLTYVVDAPFQVIFCIATIMVFWLTSLFLKVYGCFES